MATIRQTSQWFATKNNAIAVGDYTVETDTGLTKQGTGAYYNNTDYKTVNFDSAGLPLSAGAIPNPSVISITGLIQAGTNITITGVGTITSPYVINSSGGTEGLPTVLGIDPTTNNIPITSPNLQQSLTLDNSVANLRSNNGVDNYSLFMSASSGSCALQINGANVVEFNYRRLDDVAGNPIMNWANNINFPQNTASQIQALDASNNLIGINIGSGVAYNTSTHTLSATGSGGSVTSVAMTTPTGLSISGSPITTSGTLALSLTSGYVIPTTTEETNWNSAYTNRITSAVLPLSITSNAISISQATTSTNGYLSSTDWNTFNNKFSTPSGTTSQYVRGDGTLATFPSIPSGTVTSFGFTNGGGFTGTVSNSTTTPTLALTLQNATTSQSGQLTSTDWNTFNNKQAALGFTPYNSTNPSNYIALTALSATSPIFYNNSTGVISSQAASASQNGYLTSTDWSTFNGKQPAGSYLTANQTITFTPTGDVTGSSSGATSLTPALSIGAGKVVNSMIAAGTIDLTAKVTGVLPIANGGTNASTAAAARTSLGTFTTICFAMSSISATSLVGTTYYGGIIQSNSLNTTANTRNTYFPITGVLIGAIVNFRCTAGTTPTTQGQLYVRLNNTTDYTITTAVDMTVASSVYSTFTLNTTGISGTRGVDYVELKWVNQTGGTAAVAVFCGVQLIFQ